MCTRPQFHLKIRHTCTYTRSGTTLHTKCLKNTQQVGLGAQLRKSKRLLGERGRAKKNDGCELHEVRNRDKIEQRGGNGSEPLSSTLCKEMQRGDVCKVLERGNIFFNISTALNEVTLLN